MPTRLATMLARAAGSSKRTRLTALALIAAAGAAAVVTAPQQKAAIQPARQALPAGAVLTAAPVAAPARLAPSPRRIYPYSIVPGGVANREELAQAIKTDKVVADHYAGFDVDKAHPVTVSKPRAVYVSYRKGDQVYWTRKKLMLAEGEILLTDGRNELRTRCANRISDTPMLPVAADEPRQVEFDAPSEEGGILNTSADPIEEGNFDGQPYQLKTFASMASEAPADATRASTERFRFSQLGRTDDSPLRMSSSPRDLGSTSSVVSSEPPPESSRNTTPDAAEPPASTDGGEDLPKPEQPKEDPSPFIPAPPLLQPETPHGDPEQTRPADVPEPATPWLGAIAGAALLFLRRRRRDQGLSD